MRSTRCPCSSAMASPHSSQRSPGRGAADAAGLADPLQHGQAVAGHCVAVTAATISAGHSLVHRLGARARPGTPAAASGAGWSTSMRTISGAASRIARFHRRSGGSRTTTGSRRSCRAGAAVTAPASSSISRSSTSPPWAGQQGPDLGQRRLHPLGQALGVQPVDQQQAGHQLVGGEGVHQAGAAALGQLDDAGQASAVQLGDQAQQLLGPVDRCAGQQWLAARRAAARSGRRWPGGSVGAGIGLRRSVRPARGWPPGSASAASSAPCPCPGTCGPRTAGTGRSCGPPA